MDYQKTLNLPKTDFSMRAGLAKKEPATLDKWKKQDLYTQIRKQSKGQKTFILHDGPPYANGHIHIGHALNKILKDMVVKSRQMQGLDSTYLPGWDCHGLPIEHQLFKEMKKTKAEVDCVDFRKKAGKYAMKYVDIQREEFKRLGVLGDWNNPYLTLSPEYEYWILKSLSQLKQKKYIYRDLKPVNWCFNCETALAEAEVEYEDHTSPSVYVKFKVENPDVIDSLPEGKDVYLLIWTTTPWTLLANVAVAVHHRYTYSFVDTGNEILIIESSLAQDVLAKGGITDFKEIKKVGGDKLKKLTYRQPFGMKLTKGLTGPRGDPKTGATYDCSVIAVDYVTKEEGTGLVHTAPGHGAEDFEAGKKYKLDVLMPVDSKGLFTEEAKPYKGQHVFKANDNIINDLTQDGRLFYTEAIEHSYPHCWRCKKPIIFRATQQWFLEVDHDGLRGKLKDVIKRDVQWIPQSGQERILGMVTTRPDWCLSRQRYWGVPIPALACKGCKGKHILQPAVIEHFAEIVKKDGTDAWFEKDISQLVPNGFICPLCKKDDFEKTFDILDVWFDSGVSHQSVVKAMMGQKLPVDLYLEGSDQHRGWFQSSLIPAVALEGNAPYKGVLTHGFVVDGQGRKMSKSMGNVIAPQDIIKNNGVDILRLWVASSNYHEDVRLSKEILDRMIDSYRKIRNTIRYLLGNLNEYNPQDDIVAYSDLLEIDQWALSRLSDTLKNVKDAYNEYDFSRVYKLIFNFCNEDLSSFYLDILKDRLYTAPSHSVERRSACTVLFYILNHLVRVLAPILVFTSEEIFENMPKDQKLNEVDSVHLLKWLDVPQAWTNADVDVKFRFLTELRPHVLKSLEDKRRVGEIGSSLEAKIVFKTASGKDFENLNKFQDILPYTFIVSQVDIEKVQDVANGLGADFPKTEIVVEKAKGEKCSRCWNYQPSVGADKEHTTLCDRCVAAVKEIVNVG